MKLLTYILVIAVVFFSGYWFGIRSVKIETHETMHIDTVFYEKPQPVKILRPTLAIVKVPKVIFAPNDTIIRVVTETDSVNIQVPVEHKQYSDSTYRAQISGPSIGNLTPELDWIEVYNRTNIITQTITKRSRFAVTANAGIAYTPQRFQPYIGVGVGVILWQW